MKAEISEASNNPQGLLLESIHSAGYAGALGNPLLAPESAINSLNGSILEEFVAVSSAEILYSSVQFGSICIFCYIEVLFKQYGCL